MTDIYKYLQKKSKKEVINLGKAYAHDKAGFVKFAENNWNKDNGNYVRAVVSVASLLIDRPKLDKDTDLPEQIHALDYAFNTVDGKEGYLLQPIIKFFDNGTRKGPAGRQVSEIEDAYRQKLYAYDRIASLRKEIEVVDSQIKPILGEDTIARLKSYNGKPVLLACYRGKGVTPEKIFKIKITGSSLKHMAVQFKGSTVRLIGEVGGVASIKDPQTGEVIFKNDLRGMKFSSNLEKYTHYYGFQSAIKVMADDISSHLNKDDEEYRTNITSNKKTTKNGGMVKKAIAKMQKTDEPSEKF